MEGIEGVPAAHMDRRGFLRRAGRIAVVGAAGRVAAVGGATLGATVGGAGIAVAGEEGKKLGHGADRHGPGVLQDWYDTLYKGLMDEGTTPAPAARIYAVVAIAAYEAVLAGSPGRRTLAGQLNGLTPVPRDTKAKAIDWPTAASAAAGAAATELLRNARAPFVTAIAAQRGAHIDQRRSAGIPAEIVERSARYGEAVGAHVAAWAATDGSAGTYRPYTPPSNKPWMWRSTPPNFGPAIDPYWGDEVRPMALPDPDACPPPALAHEFSTSEHSGFWAEAQAVIDAVASGTDEDRAIALFWRDNPLTSGLPAGHWMRLVTQLAGERGLTLDRTAEVLAMAGITLADAFTACWRGKYQVNLLRPITYIHSYILPPPNGNWQEGWRSPVNTPQFPEFTSGHSVASQAAATVLTEVFGVFSFTDRTSLLRNSATIPPRSFASFQDAAYEAAGSRLKGGIHYPMGIDQGIDQGRRVGETVLARIRTR